MDETEFRVEVPLEGGAFEFIHIISDEVLLTTMSVSLETLNRLARDFVPPKPEGWVECDHKCAVSPESIDPKASHFLDCPVRSYVRHVNGNK